MIYIEEKLPLKVSGTTSLFLTFDYNEEIINAIKSCGNVVFHKKLKCWESPISNLSFLLDNLTYFDDITLQLKEEEKTDKGFIVSNSEEVWISELINKINSSL